MFRSQHDIVREAMLAANMTHRRLGYDFKEVKPVDIFDAIESSNVALMFQPLGNLAGAYIPSPDEHSPAGILINKNLPIPKQRYSAAHEFCHFLRQDPVSYDTEAEMFSVEAYKRDPNERIAESFAATFLMPLPLLLRLLRELDITKDKIEPHHIYNMSLRLGCSYSATVNQLFVSKIISEVQFKRYQAIPPKMIKEQLGSEGLVSSWNDIWVLSKKSQNQSFQPRPGDVLQISLDENPTTGFIWEDEVVVNESPLDEEQGDQREPLSLREKSCAATSSHEVVGRGGQRKFVFQVNNTATVDLNFYHRQPWNRDSIVESVQYRINVQDKRQGINLHLLTG